MKGVIYEEDFESSELVKFSAGLRDLIMQQDPSLQYGTLVVILNPLVARIATVQQAEPTVADLGETEHLRSRQNLCPIET